jgi:hypothetical protein|nr:MAG TPA: protein of unknown function (DUF4864) [Caudoviricetes sp.]
MIVNAKKRLVSAKGQTIEQFMDDLEEICSSYSCVITDKEIDELRDNTLTIDLTIKPDYYGNNGPIFANLHYAKGKWAINGVNIPMPINNLDKLTKAHDGLTALWGAISDIVYTKI